MTDSQSAVGFEAGGRIATLIVETSPLHLAVLSEGLRTGSISVACLDDPMPAGVLHRARESQAQVVVFGPSTLRPDLESLIGRLLKGGTRSLLVSAAPFDEMSSGLLLAGASGFLRLGEASLEDYANSVLAVANGVSALHADVVSAVLERWRSQVNTTATPQRPAAAGTRAPLTGRERDVLAGLRDGLTARQLASRLAVADKTIEAHKSRLYAKLGARNQAHAVQIAIECGLA